MPRVSFLSLDPSLVLLRVLVALIFIAHAVTRVANGTIEQFGVWCPLLIGALVVIAAADRGGRGPATSSQMGT